jgi:hypothetical protein
LLENILKATKTGISRMTEVLYFTQAQRHSSNVYAACLQRKPILYSVYIKKEKTAHFLQHSVLPTLANLAAISAENRVAIYFYFTSIIKCLQQQLRKFNKMRFF